MLTEEQAILKFRADAAALIKRDRGQRIVSVDAGAVDEDIEGRDVIVYGATHFDCCAMWVSYRMAVGEKFCRARVEAAFLGAASVAAMGVR